MKLFIVSLLVLIGAVWGKCIYKHYLKAINNMTGNESPSDIVMERFDCKNPEDDLKGPFNPNIKFYNDDLSYSNAEPLGTATKTDYPWLHHDVQGSLPVNTIVKYNKAYYFELDNVQYLSALKKALEVPCALIKDAVDGSNWGETINPAASVPANTTSYPLRDAASIQDQMGAQPLSIALPASRKNTVDSTSNDGLLAMPLPTSTSLDTATAMYPSKVNDAYNACIATIDKKLNTSSAMALPGDPDMSLPSSKIQVIHDLLKSYKVHVNEDSMYLLNIELLLYRENKYQGKHVSMSCIAKYKMFSGWYINVVAVDIIGVVPEDQIALFPVNASNPFDVSQFLVDNDVSVDSMSKSGIQCTVVDKKIKCVASKDAKAATKDHAVQYMNYAKTELKLMGAANAKTSLSP